MVYDVLGAPNAPTACVCAIVTAFFPSAPLDAHWTGWQCVSPTNCSPWSVYINTGERRLESGLSLNIWTTWCQSTIRSVSWTPNRDLSCARLWLMLRAAGVALRTSRKAARVWICADLCCDLNFFFTFRQFAIFKDGRNAGLFPSKCRTLRTTASFRSPVMQEKGSRESAQLRTEDWIHWIIKYRWKLTENRCENASQLILYK